MQKATYVFFEERTENMHKSITLRTVAHCRIDENYLVLPDVQFNDNLIDFCTSQIRCHIYIQVRKSQSIKHALREKYDGTKNLVY